MGTDEVRGLRTIEGELLIDFLGDEWHDRVEQADGLVEHEHEVALTCKAVGCIRFSEQAALGELDVPVAEFVPEERVDLAGDLTKLEFVVEPIDLCDELCKSAEDPTVSRRGGLRCSRLVSIKVHIDESRSIADLVRKVARADKLVLVEFEVLRASDLHEQAETHAVSTVITHEAKRVNAVATRLRHRLAIGAHDGRVDDDVIIGNLTCAVHRSHDHAGDPQAHDVAGCR